jgi:hypothetical protein
MIQQASPKLVSHSEESENALVPRRDHYRKTNGAERIHYENKKQEKVEVFTYCGRSMRESAADHSRAPTLRRYAATSLSLLRMAYLSGEDPLREQES